MSSLEAVATAVPGPPVHQDELAELALPLFAQKNPDLLQYMPVFANSGIKTRHFCLDVADYLEPMGWRARSEAFAEHGLDLMADAVVQVLDRAGVAPNEVDGIVFVTTTGIATPSLDARLVDRIGLRPDLHRVPVWGLGCAGGVAGLRLAADLSRVHPGRRYLVVSLELCSLSFRLDDASLRAFVANAIFADGCAAALVTSDPEAPRQGTMAEAASHQWPDSQRVMGWDVIDEGLAVVFSKDIPAILRRDLAGVASGFLGATRPDHYILHPGGAKVLDAYQEALGLDDAALALPRDVLARFGNMSSPTVLFVLEQALAQGMAAGEEAFLAAVGPGFLAEMALLHGAGARTVPAEVLTVAQA